MRPALSLILLPLLTALITGVLTLALYPFVHFARPNALWFLLGVTAIAALWGFRNFRRARLVAALLHPAASSRMLQGWSPRRASIRIFLLLSACYLLVIASAQPQWGELNRQVQREGIDIVIALDASRSMLAEDVAPDRLRAATAEIDRLLHTLDGDRVGLVVFAGVAFAQSPLTSDYGATRLYLDRVRPDAIPSQGTAIGRAIVEAQKLLVGGDNPNFQRAPNQLIILISDGEDTETNPIQAAEFARENGIRIFAVGVGTSTGGRIPLRNTRGAFEGYLTDREGQVVHSRIEDEQLREVATAGGGAYHRYTGSGSAASFLVQEIDAFDQAALSSVLRAHYIDRGHFFLWPALLLLFIALILDERPRDQRKNRWFKILIVLVVLPLSGCLDFKRLDPSVERAIAHAEEGNYDAALEALDRASSDAKSQHAFRFNRARLLEEIDAFDDAQEDYLYALGAPAEGLRVSALIGIGNTLVHIGDYEAAIARYRRVLGMRPNHPAALRNIEIAHRLRFPPCHSLEDSLEPNDSPEEAQALPASAFAGPWAELYATHDADPTAEDTDLILCGGNQDWFRIPVQGGERLDLVVDFQRLRDDDGGPPLPNKIDAHALRIAIVDAHGVPLAVDQGQEQGQGDDDAEPDATKRVSAQKSQRRIERLTIDANRAPAYLRIDGNHGLEYRYDITLNITPACSALEDEFEANDRPEDATDLPSGEHQARICIENEDWYQVQLQAGDHLFVDITPQPTEEHPEPTLRAAFPDAPLSPQTPSFGAPAAARQEWASGPVEEAQRARWGVASSGDFEGDYKLDAFAFEPCPTGNDRFEPNNRPSDASELSAEQNNLRHLRLCPQDQDWFLMALPPVEEDGEDPDAPLEPRAFSAWAEFDANGTNDASDDTPATPARDVFVELWDVRSGERIATSQPIIETDYSDDSDEARGVIAATLLPPDAEAVAIRVYGDPGFYHLRFPDTEPPPPPSESSPDENQENEDQESEDQENEDQESDADEEQSADQENPGERNEDQDQDAAPASEDEEQAQRDALMHLLESLEDDSVNLPLMQALEREPPARMQNEW